MRYQLGLTTIVPTSGETKALGPSYFPAEVQKIILSDKDPDWEDNGGWDALGLVHFVPSYSDTKAVPNAGARPFNPHIKHYPLIGEHVMIMQLPDPQVDNPNYSSWYYIGIINLWDHPHHNVFPKTTTDINNDNKLTYQDVSSGLSHNTANSSSNNLFGKTFQEKSYIKPVLPFEGDLIFEGRWGQSLRFGSTVKNLNPWSKSGNNGDPIIILKNNQGDKSEKGWIPVIEDINIDGSSVYLCYNQNIPLDTVKDRKSYSGSNYTPDPIDKFIGNQILLNSGRLVLNAKDDTVFLIGKKSINVSSTGTFNIDVNNSIFNSKVQLGLGANEPILLGKKTIDLLKDVFDKLLNLSTELGKVTVYIGNEKVILTEVNIAGSDLKLTLEKVLQNIDDLKSKNSFTI